MRQRPEAKTPYSAAIRLYERKLDETAKEIAACSGAMHTLEQQRAALGLNFQTELQKMVEDWTLPPTQWRLLRRSEDERLKEEISAAAEQLAGLRDAASDVYASLLPLRAADDRMREAQRQRVQAGEQAELDDISAAKIFRRRVKPPHEQSGTVR